MLRSVEFDWNVILLAQVLCRAYPTEFASYFHYCRSLRFDDKPDYAYLKRIFRDLFIREGLNIVCFNWFLELPSESCSFFHWENQYD